MTDPNTTPSAAANKNFLARALDSVERVGNRLPDPLFLFIYLCIFVVLVSWLASLFGLQATHPSDGRVIAAENLLSAENLRRMLTEMVKNFASFPPLGLVLVTVIGIGVAEQSGLINSALKKLVMAVPKKALTATLVFGGIMSNLAADAGYVVLTPLGALLFAAFGRHPLAGLAAAFAGVSGGFSANLIITSLDPLLGGISTKAAQIIDPSYTVQASGNYYFMLASTFLLVIVGTYITEKIVEPRLGVWQRPPGLQIDSGFGNLTDSEKSGLKAALWTLLACSVVVLALVLPQNGVLRTAEHGLKPFYESLVPLIMLVFLFCGAVYAWKIGKVKSDKDITKMATDSMNTMGAYIILAFVAAQFVAYFSWSNLGLIFAITGADALKTIGLIGIPLVLSFILVTSFLNIFIGSASAKWAIMGPVFVPMLMLMGYSPELAQNAYRIGDSVTNIISPLLPYFPIIIAFARKYDPKVGIGTLISIMIPYSFGFLILWSAMLVVWLAFGLPLGPDAPLNYLAPVK